MQKKSTSTQLYFVVPKISKILGIILILLGLISYFATGAEHFTALIPSFFGLIFFGLGYLGDRSEKMRKHSMHMALLVAILGLFGTFGGLTGVISSLGGTELERPAASYAQAIMAILCILFLGMGIKSFIDARKSQDQTVAHEESMDSPES